MNLNETLSPSALLDCQYHVAWKAELIKHPGGLVLLAHLRDQCPCGSAECAHRYFQYIAQRVERDALVKNLPDMLDDLVHQRNGTYTAIAQVLSLWITKMSVDHQLKEFREGKHLRR
jgi:hypothetical protein